MLKICARAAIMEVWAKKEFWCLTDLMRNLKNYVFFFIEIYFQSNWILKLHIPYWFFPYPIDKISCQYKKYVITEIKHSITRRILCYFCSCFLHFTPFFLRSFDRRVHSYHRSEKRVTQYRSWFELTTLSVNI